MIPHLIHIGLPKAGSTYLQHWFAAHPQLAYCHAGMAGFGDVQSIAAAAVVPDPRIRCRVTSWEVLSAPFSNVGSDGVDMSYDRSGRPSIAEEQARVCRTLAELFPRATILIVTRGFRSAILSGFSQFACTGGTDDFADVLKPPQRDYPWGYDKLIGQYRAAFGRDAVIVLPFELLRDDPQRFQQDLEGRLGLDRFPFHLPAANVSAGPEELAWYPAMTRAVARFPVARRRIMRRYRRLLFRRRLAGLARLLQRLSPRPPVTPALVGDDFLEQFRGQAETLRDDPLYRPYLTDYLL